MGREEWNNRYRAVPLLWDIDPGPFLGQELGTMAPGHALDLGAGEGRNSIWLAQHGWRVTAVDFSDVALDRGRQLADQAGVGSSIRWVNEDVVDFRPDPSDPLDLVVVLFLHLHPEPRRQVLRRAVEALAPGGTVLVVGYDRANAEGGSGVRDPAILFSPADIAEDLEGLRIEQGYQLRIGDAVDAIVRASKPRAPLLAVGEVEEELEAAAGAHRGGTAARVVDVPVGEGDRDRPLNLDR